MTHRSPIVVGIGEILWDLFPDTKKLGGTVTNFVYHAAALGAHGVVVSSVGKDELGRDALNELEKRGLSRQYIREDPDHPTSTVQVDVQPGGEPVYTIHNNVAPDFLRRDSELDELSSQADVICYGTLAQRGPVCRETIQSFLETSRPDCLRICDINLRQKFYSPEVVTRSFELANVVKVNDDELQTVAEIFDMQGDERELVAQISDRFKLNLVALTRGNQGSLLRAGGEVHEHDGHKVTVEDTVGAGDCFTAALAMGLLNGDKVAAIHESASRRAAYVCTQVGGTPLMEKA